MKVVNHCPEFHLCLNSSFGFLAFERLFFFIFLPFFFSYGSDIFSQVHPLLQNHSHKGIDKTDQQLETRIRITVFFLKTIYLTSIFLIYYHNFCEEYTFFLSLCLCNISVGLVFSVHMFSFSNIFIF